MKKIVYSIFTALLMCIFAVNADAGLAMTSTNTVGLGKIYSFFKSTNTFHFVNNGKTDITISDVVSTCPCITADKIRKVLKPGEKYVLETRFNARSVHNKFSRGVWLVTDDPAQKRFLVKVAGEVMPLFSGVPEQAIVLASKDENVAFTNKFTFTAMTKNYSLKEPSKNTMPPGVSVALSQDAGKYQLTTIIHPSKQRRIAIVKLPVKGPVKTDPIQIKFKFVVGASLKASPSRMIITSLGATLKKRFYINTYSCDIKPNELKWLPQIEGLEIKKEVFTRRSPITSRLSARKASSQPKRKSKTRYTCTAVISPEALKKIMAMAEPALTFSYPDHKPVKISLILLKPRAK